MSEFGQVPQPEIENHAEVRPGIEIKQPECRDDRLNDYLDTNGLDIAIINAYHLKRLTPHFRSDPAFQSIKFTLNGWREFFETYLELDKDLSLESKIWISIKLKHINELLGHREN